MELTTETLEHINNIKLEEIDIKGFEELLNKLSVKLDVPDDAITILFSGCINDLYTGDIVGNIKGARYIGETQIGKFINSDECRDILESVIQNELKRGTFDINLVKNGTNTIKFSDSTLEDVIESVYGTNDAVMYSTSNGNMILLEDFRDIEGNELKLKFKDSDEMTADALESPFLHIYGSNEVIMERHMALVEMTL